MTSTVSFASALNQYRPNSINYGRRELNYISAQNDVFIIKQQKELNRRKLLQNIENTFKQDP